MNVGAGRETATGAPVGNTGEGAAAGRAEVVAGFAAAVAADLALLADLHDRELTLATVAAARAAPLREQLALVLGSAGAKASLAAWDEALGEVVLDDRGEGDLAAQYSDVYLRFRYRASPCESVWMTEDGLERQAPMFAVQRVLAQHGLKADDWARRPEDHIVIELRFLAWLCDRGEEAALVDAAHFLDAHLLRWVHLFAHGLAVARGPAIYVALANVTSDYLVEVRQHLADITGVVRQDPARSDAGETRVKKPEKTCGDPDDRPFVPGVAPSW